MSSRWSEDITIHFVTEYLKHECLWNFKSSLYKNKQARQAAYESLEKNMNISGFTENEIKSKIKNIRSTYSQELRKIKDSKKPGCGANAVYVPTIKWFKLLNNSIRNMSLDTAPTQINLEPKTEPLEYEYISIEDSNEYSTQESENQTPEPIVTHSPQESFATPPIRNKRQRLTQLNEVVNQLKGIAEVVNSQQEENEFEVFARNVGLQLKAMPLKLALEAQMHITTYLSNVRLQELTSEQDRPWKTSPTPSTRSDSISSAVSIGEYQYI